MNSLFLKGYKSVTRFLSLVVTLSFLGTSTLSSVPFQNKPISVPQNLAVTSPLVKAPEPDFVSFRAPDVIENEKSIKSVIKKAIGKNKEAKQEEVIVAVVESLFPYRTDKTEERVAYLAYVALADHFDWKLRPADYKEFFGKFKRSSKGWGLSARLLALFIAFGPMVASQVGCTTTAHRRPAAASTAIGTAVSARNLPALIQIASNNSNDELVRKNAVQQINHFLQHDYAGLSTITILRGLSERLSNEDVAAVRLELVRGIGLALNRVNNSSEPYNESIRGLYVLYYNNLKTIADHANATNRTERLEKSNAEAENRAILTAANTAGRPINFNNKVSFYINLTTGANQNRDLNGRVFADLNQQVQGTTQNNQTTYSFEAADLTGLTTLYGNNGLSSDAQVNGKFYRLELLRAMAFLKSTGSIQTFVTALSKNDDYKRVALQALVDIGTPAEGATGHNFGSDTDTIVTPVLAILTANGSTTELRSLAGQVLNLTQSQAVAEPLRTYLAGQQSLTSHVSLAQTYAQSVILSATTIKGDATKKANHGALLVRILGLTGRPASNAHRVAAEALQQIEYTAGINALLETKGRTDALLFRGNNPTPQQQEENMFLNRVLQAINATLTALGFDTTYPSLKARVLDNSAPINVRVSLIGDIGANVATYSSTAPIASDLAPLLGHSETAIVASTLTTLNQLPMSRIPAPVQTTVWTKVNDANSDVRTAALTLIRDTRFPLTAAHVTTLIGARSELNFRIAVLAQATRDAAQRGLVNTAAVKTALEAIAQSTSEANAIRTDAVGALFLIEGDSPTVARLTQLRDMALPNTPRRSFLDLEIVKAGWPNPGAERNIYGTIERSGSNRLTGNELATFLTTNIPATFSGTATVNVLNFLIQERQLQGGANAVVDQVALALALVRLGNTSQLSLLFGELGRTNLNAAQKRAVEAALITVLNNASTSEAVRVAALATDRIPVLNAALGRTFTNTSLPTLRALVPRVNNMETLALIAERIAGTGTRDAADLSLVSGILSRINTAQGLANQPALSVRVLRASLLIQNGPATNGNNNGGNMGRGETAILEIWKSAPSLPDTEVQAAKEGAIYLAAKRLASAEFEEGSIAADLAEIAKRRIKEGVKVTAVPSHVISKSEEKENDLFLLGFADGSEARVAIDFFTSKEETAEVDLARAIVHELLEGARDEIVENHPALKQKIDQDPEAFHYLIIELVEKVAFADSKLPEVARGIIQSKLEENEALDALDTTLVAQDALERAQEILTDKALEFKESEADVQASLEAAFGQEGVSLSEKVAAHLILPNDVTSPLASEVLPVVDADALIVLDAEVLKREQSLPEALTKAIDSGRVLFFGEPAGSVKAEAFVKNEGELLAKAADLKKVTKVVTLLTPDQMRTHFGEYGVSQLGDKPNFVAPLNTRYDVTVHLALASELIRVNFDLSQLSDAAKLLLALEIDSLDLAVGDMLSILTALGQIPSEIIRNGKKRLSEDLIGAALKRIAA